MYRSHIVRNPTLEDGPGFETLYYDNQPVASWPVVTGDRELDPAEYGGICPPVRVVMNGLIHPHQEPNSPIRNQDHCVLTPCEEDKELVAEQYPKRTWYRDGDRFKRHKIGWGQGGKSTGCLCTPHWYWEYSKNWLNKAYQHSQDHGYEFITEIHDFQSYR